MKQLTSLLIVLFFGAHCAFAAGINFEHGTFSEALAKAKKEDKMIFVDVYATWCGPCKWMSANAFMDEEVGDYFNENFVSLKMDGEKGEGPDFMMKYALDAYPSLLFFSPEGELVKKMAGGLDSNDLMKLGKQAIDPSFSPLIALSKQYEEGNRDRDFLIEYAMELEQNEKDIEWILESYKATHSPLDLENENDFMVFKYYAETLNSPQVAEFLENAELYEELYPNSVVDIVNNIGASTMIESIEAGNTQAIEDMSKKVYPRVEFFYGELYPTEADFLAALIEVYDEYVSEK